MAREDYWEWLNLVETDGPFLSKSALKSFYPSGLPKADASVDDVNAVFVSEHSRWMADWLTLSGDDYTISRNRWVETVLRDLLEWGDFLNLNPNAEFDITSPDRRVEVHPFATLEVDSGVKAIVLVVNKTDDLRATGTDGWAADSIDRMSALLRASTATIGIVTDGRWWALVSAAPETTTASGVFDATWWRGEEKPNRDSFFALANISSIALGAPEKRLDLLFQESVASAEQITEALGDQVRRAVELVLQSMSDSHLRARANGETSPLPVDARKVYEGTVTILMRVVFLLFAEERGLFPQHELFRTSYSISGIRQQLSLTASENSEESLDHSAETWHRLLAVSQAVYGGATFDDIRMPAYGGSLFDPDRFPWMYATDSQGKLLLRISDRVMFAVLDAVQVARVDGEARNLSFRDLDVEQIGYVYEGLLGYSAEYVDEVVIGLEGKSGYEPEITLAELENIKQLNSSNEEFVKQLLDHLKETQEFSKPRTANQLSKALGTSDSDALALAKTRLRHALLGDEDLVERLLPFYALIRNDLRSFPYVVPAGGLVMTESQQRSNTGTHYTPRSLAEEVVLHALEPLVYYPGPLDTEDSSQWKLKSSTEILNLKVADIAVGSGAFLVAAARYLAARLVEARAMEGLDIAQQNEIERWAIREVVARCLYGADINGMAVEMCKLSLWLISMDPGKPFSFVDDRIFRGNSLVGVISEAQIKQQHIDPKQMSNRSQRLLSIDVDRDLARAAALRHEIASGQVDDADKMRSSTVKKRLLKTSQQETQKLHLVASGIIAASLNENGKPGKKLEGQLNHLSDLLVNAFPMEDSKGEVEPLLEFIQKGLLPTVETDFELWEPLHWVLEAPDVLSSGKGFDSIIGNPPFLGGKKISASTGTNLREFFVNQLAGGAKGNSDLVAYFFLRAFSLLAKGGTLGLIATNTIAQGDTREVGLDQMVDQGFEIYRSIQSKPWPARSANLEYAAVWGTTQTIPVNILRIADGAQVPKISTLLEAAGRINQRPQKIDENIGIAFKGSNVNCVDEFCLTPAEAELHITSVPDLAVVLKPFVGGEDINQSIGSKASRWIVDFTGISFADAQTYQFPFEYISRRVKPARQLLKHKPRLQENWWLYEAPALELRKATQKLTNVIALSRVSKTVLPVLVPAAQTFTDGVVVFATDDFADFCFLSSSVHQIWAITYSSTLETRVSYAPSDAFETLPRPTNTSAMRILGERLNQQRTRISMERGLGLTDLYNLVNSPSVLDDPDVNLLREIHRHIDEEVFAAYSWQDIDLDHGFHTYRQMLRYTISQKARLEMINRLLELNFHLQNTKKNINNLTPIDISEVPKPEDAMF